MNLLMENSLIVDEDVVERLLQASLFYADTVCLRASAAFPDGDRGRGIQRRVQELRELGILKLWAHEYEVSVGGTVTPRWRGALGAQRVNDIVVPESYGELVRSMDEALRPTRSIVYSESDQAGKLREGIGEVVEFRRSIQTLAVTSILEKDGIAAQGSLARGIPHAIRSVALEAGRTRNVVEEVVRLCAFGALSGITTKGIIECRKHMPAFRDYLARLENGTSQRADLTSESIARQILQNYQMLLEEHARISIRSHSLKMATEVFWDVVGAILPASIVVKYFGTAIKFSRSRRDFRPFLLLGSLRKALPSTTPNRS